MADPLTWGIIALSAEAVGTTMSIASGIGSFNQQQANADAQEQMFEYNARQERREAAIEESETAENARRARIESERVKSMQRAAYGKSGAALSAGSPLAVLGDTAANQEMQIQDLHRDGATRYNQRMAQSQNLMYQGKIAGMNRPSGFSLGVGIGQTLISGISSGASGFMNAYAFKDNLNRKSKTTGE